MRKLLFAFIIAILLTTGCMVSGEEVSSSKGAVELQWMFEVDSCNGYRWTDAGHVRYVIICSQDKSVAYGR